jgi:hypothetical protein
MNGQSDLDFNSLSHQIESDQMTKWLIPWLSLIETCHVAYLIFGKLICTHSWRILIARFVLRVPVAVSAFVESGFPAVAIVAVFFAAVLTILLLSFVLGAFSLRNWILPAIVLGPTTLSPIVVDGWSWDAVVSLIGFGSGSITFPLDWSVCWKEPPVAHLVMFVVGSFIGSIIDFARDRSSPRKLHQD